MPDLARWFIKASFLYLAAAAILGVLLALGVASLPLSASAYPTYIHLFVAGWLMQLIFGVAYWLFPRYSKEQPYGQILLAQASFLLLNIGLPLRVIAEPAQGVSDSPVWATLLVASALLQWVGVVAYAVYIWGRVKTK